ncbi:MAG TPA: SUMF1/EgtB/PvdO family nonheme iron enzyme [Stellaceae bacterium]|nr:SUMF1/EgtB/PvdO family nonheme iron enzyme [Stellaceae bacterium]
MPDRPTIRVFISSPSDVRPERLKAEQIVARLDREFAYHFHVEAVLWEREPLVASHHFQDPDNIPPPRGTDIVVVILWSRLGLPLPADKFRGALSGRSPVTGTEWEFEDALAGAREHDGVPHLLLYRKTAEPTGGFGDRTAVQQRLEQLDLVEDFFTRWFRSADGQSLSAASHSFAATAEFEDQLYDHLYALLERRAGAAAEGVSIRWHRPPFRALLSYEYEDAPIFFGRTRARNELRELLARQIERGSAFVLVFGASGSGKSSLVKAGLLPDLALPGMIGRVGLVRRAVMRPSDAGGDPLAALAAAILSPTALSELAGLQYTPERLCALLREAPGQAELPIRQGLFEAGRAAEPPLTEIAEARLAIVVDQLEEIFTIGRLGQTEREAFVAALDTLAKSGLVWVIATMRSDFFDRLETMPSLLALTGGEARCLLAPPDAAEIGQIIRQPAQEAGLRFEHDAANGATLDETICEVAARDRGVLPLLSFLLDQLWQRRSDTGVVTFATYRELGGLEGAIVRRAEEVFQAQPEAVQRELVVLLRELVTIERGKAVSRAALLSRFPEGTPLRALVDAFLDPEARLLASDSDDGRAQLRLAHEGLLSHWPRAAEQVAADARDLELRGRLEEEAVAWHRAHNRRQKRGRLIAGLPLAEARALLARWGARLPAEIADFIAASRRAARWRRVRLWGMIASAPLVATLLVVIIWAGFVWRGVHQVEAEWATNQEFVRIKAGCFEMGSSRTKGEAQYDPESYATEEPVHKVCLKSFDLAKVEVTQGEWRRVMVGIAGFPDNPNPSYFKGNDWLPVEGVNWNEAQRFVWRMSFFGHGHYRLPSESEWEYAARAGTTTSRYWGDNIDDGCTYENITDQSWKKEAGSKVALPSANCTDGYGFKTAPVGSFNPNPWGLYDMLGNVETWVEDCYVDNYKQTPIDGRPYTKSSCTNRVIRSGSWDDFLRIDRAANRNHNTPDYRSDDLGFRVARTITP